MTKPLKEGFVGDDETPTPIVAYSDRYLSQMFETHRLSAKISYSNDDQLVAGVARLCRP